MTSGRRESASPATAAAVLELTGASACGRAVVLDVDGVVSPVHPQCGTWGDEVVAGHLFGPVTVSPTLCQRLDRINRSAGVRCWWLTSWTAEMRVRMHPFPGRDWPVVCEQGQAPKGRRWWKLAAMEAWLDSHPEIQALAWCDDELRGGRHATLRRRLHERGSDALLLVPSTDVGLTPQHLIRLDAWTQK